MTFSLEQLLIDHDIIGMIKTAAKGIHVSEETLDVKAIMDVGAGKSFQSNKSTLNNIDIQSNPDFFDRTMVGDWTRAGSRNIVDVVHESVLNIKQNYKVAPTDRDLLKDMKIVVEMADKDYMARI